jgi:hypothetical protein
LLYDENDKKKRTADKEILEWKIRREDEERHFR